MMNRKLYQGATFLLLLAGCSADYSSATKNESIIERPASECELYVDDLAKASYSEYAPAGGLDLVVNLRPSAVSSPTNETKVGMLVNYSETNRTVDENGRYRSSQENNKTEIVFGKQVEGSQNYGVVFTLISDTSNGSQMRRKIKGFAFFRDLRLNGSVTERIWLKHLGTSKFLPDMIDSANYNYSHPITKIHNRHNASFVYLWRDSGSPVFANYAHCSKPD